MARVKAKSGTRMTKERGERLADEAEKRYDLSKARRVRLQPGRPSLEEGVSPRIS